MTDFYKEVAGNNSILGGPFTNIDLREEMHALLYGRADFIPQGRPFILRVLSDTHCVCWDNTSGGSRTPNCRYCGGEGYLWSEGEFIMWMAQGIAPIYKPGFLANGQYPQAQIGYTDPNRATCYCEYTVFPNYERYTFPANQAPDKLYALKVNDDGSKHVPIVRLSKWKILNVVPLHGDYGRVEFFELSLDKEIIG